jgi:hypothetical protein
MKALTTTGVEIVIRSEIPILIPINPTKTSLGDTIKTPLAVRLKKSKFAALVAGMTDEDVKLLSVVIGFHPKVISAINMYLMAENTGIQRYAIAQELIKRGIVKGTELSKDEVKHGSM